jgi:hypothetical protein
MTLECCTVITPQWKWGEDSKRKVTFTYCAFFEKLIISFHRGSTQSTRETPVGCFLPFLYSERNPAKCCSGDLSSCNAYAHFLFLSNRILNSIFLPFDFHIITVPLLLSYYVNVDEIFPHFKYWCTYTENLQTRGSIKWSEPLKTPMTKYIFLGLVFTKVIF